MASLNTTFNTAKGIKAQQKTELNEIDKAYDTSGYQNLINQYSNSYDTYSKQQQQFQNQQTDQAIKEINQNKEYQKQDYLKEQKGAYTDYQKQADKFANEGTNFRHSGVSETAQTQLYTTYQNRVATARESYNRAITNYDNQITNARLQNNAKIAEIAFQAMTAKLEMGLKGFEYMQGMRINKVSAKSSVRDRTYNRWADMQTRKEQKKYYNSFRSGSGGGSRSYSYSSGGYSSGYNSSGGAKINKKKTPKSNKNTKYTANSTPISIKGKALKNANALAKTVMKKGYVTQSQLVNATKGLTKKERDQLLNSYKRK